MDRGRIYRTISAAILILGVKPVAAADPSPPVTAAVAPIEDVAPIDDNVFTRLYHAYAGEWGKAAPPGDPNAPPGRRGADQLPPQPLDSPPYPFTDWSYGGASTIGASLPNSVDTPLQSALFPAASGAGKWLSDQHIQVYGWVSGGGNLSNDRQYGGNRPVPDIYTPNVFELDQAALRVERIPDTVQRDHIDWGFRFTGIYGETYRYTTALGLWSNQYAYHDRFAGADIPEAFGEIYLPQFAEGLIIRFGRFLTLPDIESQLTPGNYLYSHNISFPTDPTSNTGFMTTLKLNKNWLVQAGLSAGAETVPWNAKTVFLPNGYKGPRDPGTKPSFTGCVQWQSDSASDAIYGCVEDFNGGQWGYNNENWFGGTYFHKFNDQWHLGIESYYEFQKNVNSVAAGYAGTPFQYMLNPPSLAFCAAGQTRCLAQAYTVFGFLNYRIGSLDNVTLRLEFFNDEKGQRTGVATRYFNQTIGYQHWFSPSVELRPEIGFYYALDNPAFDNGTKHNATIAAADLIVHF